MKIENMRKIRDMAQECLMNGRNAEVLKKLFDSAENDTERMEIAVSLAYHMNDYSSLRFTTVLDLDEWILLFRLKDAIGVPREFGIMQFSNGVIARTYRASHSQSDQHFHEYLSEAARIYEWMANYIHSTPSYHDNGKEGDYRNVAEMCRLGKKRKSEKSFSYCMMTFYKLLREKPNGFCDAHHCMSDIQREISYLLEETRAPFVCGYICWAYETLALITRHMILGGEDKDALFEILDAMNRRVNFQMSKKNAEKTSAEECVECVRGIVESMRFTIPAYENIAYTMLYIAAVDAPLENLQCNNAMLKLLHEDFQEVY